MMVVYLIIALVLGGYWKTHSLYSGYKGRNMNIMKTSTILIAMILWPIALIMKASSGNLLR